MTTKGNVTFFNRNALARTEAELRLMASAAIIGDSNQPVKGSSIATLSELLHVHSKGQRNRHRKQAVTLIARLVAQQAVQFHSVAGSEVAT